MSKYWIKLWVETLYDRKVGHLPDNEWRRFVECCLMAGEVDRGGRLPPFQEMTWITHQSGEILQKELENLKELGIIGQDDAGYYVINFEKRQAPVDVKRRVAEHRRRNAGRNDPVTKRYPEVQKVLTTTTLNNIVSSSNTGNERVTKRYTDVTELLDALGILDRRQPSRDHAPAIVRDFTVSEILTDHDPDGAIVANLGRWAAAAEAGVEIADRPALVWCKIVEGQAPPEAGGENGNGFTEEEKSLFER